MEPTRGAKITMYEPRRPTPESIEAALKKYDTGRTDATPADGSDSQTFINLVSKNDRLKQEIFSAIKFLIDIDKPVEITRLNLLVFKINELCSVFFWVGWHARGAVEET